MNYFSLINALSSLKHNIKISKPDEWLLGPSLLNETSNIFETRFSQKINISKAKSRLFYPIFLENDIEPPIAMLRWLKGGVKDDTFNESMSLARKSTLETKLLSNLLKITQQIWPVGANLERWKLASTNICKFCNNVDDIFHAFCKM